MFLIYLIIWLIPFLSLVWLELLSDTHWTPDNVRTFSRGAVCSNAQTGFGSFSWASGLSDISATGEMQKWKTKRKQMSQDQKIELTKPLVSHLTWSFSVFVNTSCEQTSCLKKASWGYSIPTPGVCDYRGIMASKSFNKPVSSSKQMKKSTFSTQIQSNDVSGLTFFLLMTLFSVRFRWSPSGQTALSACRPQFRLCQRQLHRRKSPAVVFFHSRLTYTPSPLSLLIPYLRLNSLY